MMIALLACAAWVRSDAVSDGSARTPVAAVILAMQRLVDTPSIKEHPVGNFACGLHFNCHGHAGYHQISYYVEHTASGFGVP